MVIEKSFTKCYAIHQGYLVKKLRQNGQLWNHNYGAYPHYYVDNMKELHGLMRSLERIENPYTVKGLWLTPHSRKNEFNLFIEYDFG